MPVIDMPLEALLARINAGTAAERAVAAEALVRLLPTIGCAVESIAETRQFACRTCGKIADRTAAQGPPPACSQCGTDFREAPAALEDLGPNRVLRLELLAVRPDIFDVGGMARFVRGYLGLQTGAVRYDVAPPTIRVRVDGKLAEETSLRPFIACAVMRDVRLDHGTIKMLMNLQEDLHWALGRDRKLASIGVYDLDALQGADYRYDAVEPDGLRFVPLGLPPDRPESRLTPREILERHKTGQAYAHLLAGFTAYPLLRDEAGTVLSMPPIINSEATRVTLNTRQFFIDVTGLSQRSVDRALNVMVTSLKEILPGATIEAVTIRSGRRRRTTPELKPVKMTLDVRETSATIGESLDAPALAGLLRRMGHDVAAPKPTQKRLTVFVPAYRNDVMHPVDLIEDAAIAFGYENLRPALVPTLTLGRPREIEERSAVARRVFAGLGFHQVMTLVLTNAETNATRWRFKPGDRIGDELLAQSVQIENPISTEQTHCRVWLLPGLLETLAINKQYDLPQHIFEIGDCCFVDPEAETGAREQRFAAAAMIGTHVGYADIRAVADAFTHELAAACEVRPAEMAFLIPGRAAALHDRRGRRIGAMGELHPEVLEAYGLKHPAAVLELNLEQLLAGDTAEKA